MELTPITGVFIRERRQTFGHRGTCRRRKYEDSSIDWNYAATLQEMLRAIRSWRKARKNMPVKSLEKARPCQYLDFRLLAPELGK